MAVVLDALAPHVLNKINAMGQEEIRMLLSVSGEISNLKDNMEPLRTALTDAERRRVTEEKVQTWVSKLKDVMYEAADILELCQLEAMERQEEHSNSSSRGGGLCSLEGVLREKLQDWREKLPFVGGCLGDILQPFLWCVQNLGFAHEVGTRIKKLNERLDDIIKGARRFEFLGSTLPSSSASYPRDECANLFEPDLVGEHIQKKTEKLVQELIADHGSSSSQGNVRMVAIVGLGGIGKSTLAKKVYASEAIDKEFKTKVWLSVTKQVETPVDLLRRAVNQLAGKDHCGAEQDKHTLTNSLIAALSKKKFLLVLDDVWNTEAWDHVLRIPVLNASLKQPGSQVLVTSRKDDVVDRMGASSFWRVDKLNDQDSWCLLKKQATNNSWVGAESDFDDMIDIGMNIVKKCDGLPLAIKVMGGLLGRNPTKSDWDHVWKKILHWNEVGSPAELNYSIRLSYDDLSPEVKQCFLYYSLFPKGSGFMEDIVISMWISEGLVKDYGSSESDDGSLESGQVDLEEIGARYHRELFARNLLEPDDSTENTGGYTLHDVVRTFAEFMVKEEAFVFHKDEADFRNLPENHKFRRISIFASELELTILNNQETLRTLLIDGEIKPGGSLTNFASLRVLDISSEKSDWLVNSLCGLRHLRYLAFSDTNISRLPGDIHKMRFLQHIQLNDCKKLDKLPDNITKLTCLRYISLLGSNVDVIPRGFGGLTNLRSLYGFPVKMDGDWCTLQELWALSHLISLTVESLENVSSSSVAKMANISSKESLKYLELNCYKEDEEEEEDEEDEEEEEEDEEDEDEEEEEEEEVVVDEDGNPIEEYEEKQEERQVGPEQKQRIKAVFDELCPPPMLETLIISRYFGLELPEWLQSPVATSFKKLKTIALVHIIYCNRLPNGLCRIHGLEDLEIDHAPGIEHVQADFQTLTIGDGGAIVATPFKSLKRLELLGMSAWKRWDWEEEEQSKDVGMPALVFLRLRDCLLTQLPSGLASERRHNLRTIYLEELTLLECVENFPSVVTLHVHNCPGLQRISGLAKLQMLCIEGCPKLKLLEGVLVLDRMDLDDEPWEVSGPDARRTPKRQNQVTSEAVDQLLKNLVITRESSVNR